MRLQLGIVFFLLSIRRCFWPMSHVVDVFVRSFGCFSQSHTLEGQSLISSLWKCIIIQMQHLGED